MHCATSLSFRLLIGLLFARLTPLKKLLFQRNILYHLSHLCYKHDVRL